MPGPIGIRLVKIDCVNTSRRFHLVHLWYLSIVVLLSWLWMQIIHELGHVLAALATGVAVERVVLHPLAFSRTDLHGGTSSPVIIWAGPVVGCLLPACALAIASMIGTSLVFLFRFFAGFCLIANGAYIGIGWIDQVGDAGDLLRHGTPIWAMIVFGCIGIAAGLWLWHGLGAAFGLKRGATLPKPKLIIGLTALLAATVMVELIFSAA